MLPVLRGEVMMSTWFPRRSSARIGSVSGVGQYLPGLHVRYDRRQIMDMVGTVFTGITVYEGLCLPLQGLADGGLDALPRLFRGQSFQQMRGIIR